MSALGGFNHNVLTNVCLKFPNLNVSESFYVVVFFYFEVILYLFYFCFKF